ncbi:MAG: DUF2889 domain-containing protein [Ilumatobacteraceae bacterium]|jgi:hypothetical protein
MYDEPILPADPDLPLLHTRNYEVRAYKVNDGEILLRGAVRDLKPGGLYIENDDEPLAIHHMVIEMRISYPMLNITYASAELKEFPHHECPGIAPKYKQLEGLSIARGFTHKVRELFGGPRGCTHTTALLQAMAPVAIQCGWSMQMLKAQEILASGKELPTEPSEARKMAYKMNLNTCHIWDENGDHVRNIEAGIPMEAPVWVEKRMAKLGRSTDEWQRKRI